MLRRREAEVRGPPSACNESAQLLSGLSELIDALSTMGR